MMEQCESCPSVETRKFGEAGWPLCRKCVGDGVPACSMCGAMDEGSFIHTGDVSACSECCSIESIEYLEWEDGKTEPQEVG